MILRYNVLGNNNWLFFIKNIDRKYIAKLLSRKIHQSRVRDGWLK